MPDIIWKPIIRRLIGAALGVGCLVLAVYFARDSWVLVSDGAIAQAKCTQIETKTTTGRNNGTKTTWQVAFETATGERRTGTIDASFSGVKEGETIEVIYLADDPAKVQANRWWSLWGMSVLCAAGAMVFGGGLVQELIRKT